MAEKAYWEGKQAKLRQSAEILTKAIHQVGNIAAADEIDDEEEIMLLSIGRVVEACTDWLEERSEMAADMALHPDSLDEVRPITVKGYNDDHA